MTAAPVIRKGAALAAALLVLILAVLGGAVLSALSTLPDPLFAADYSTVVLDENGAILRVFLNSQEQLILPDDGRPIPPKLQAAVITYEDKRFERHWGVDPLAVMRALYQNIRHRDRISGASTITMQVARLMRPKERTVKNKLLEMFQALAIELRYRKDEILKFYLVHAPYGGNIIGYRTAALRYFGKEPEKLSWAEAATLAVLPNNPANISPSQNPERLRDKRDNLLRTLHEAGYIDTETYTLALAEPVPQGQHPFPLSAPHLAERLARNSDDSIIHTTISKDIQDQAALLLKNHIAALERFGVENGAVLITETATGEVKAYVASHDYFDSERAGMIDGVQMKRSSGSILKPFLYALAIDQGLIIPESVLPDIPTSYSGFTPHNADGTFSGVVRAREALVRSLNAPAVHLLSLYGVDKFYHFLREAGVQLQRQPHEYGLSLVLGSSESSLWELSCLYRGLGTFGRAWDISVLKDRKPEQTQPLISIGAAYLVLDILKDVRRPGLESQWQAYGSSLPIAWKTGTSYGSRDAWAVGVTPQWTIAVWVGNFSGGSIPGLTGVDSAAPLLFQLLNRLPKNPYQTWFSRPDDDLMDVAVSPVTGYRLQGTALETVPAAAPASAKPLRYSPYERTLFVTLDEGMMVCSLCWNRQDLKTVQKVIYPLEVARYLGGAPGQYILPPHNPDCPALKAENPITVVYPQPSSLLFIPRGTDGEYQRVKLEALHANPGKRLFWYIDDAYLGQTQGSHHQLVSLENGWHRLYLVDEDGYTRNVSFRTERR
ncbi:MAG: penicillin-binding protein 1C [Firmicutes bacterium]|jgi:penicillin-binding protein 1C|nr:penicillin-binding protein 1C [Bacillota bacterium]